MVLDTGRYFSMFLVQLAAIIRGAIQRSFLTYDECMQGRDVDLRLGSGIAPPVC